MKRADVERFKFSNSLTATVLYCLLGVVLNNQNYDKIRI